MENKIKCRNIQGKGNNMGKKYKDLQKYRIILKKIIIIIKCRE